MASDKSFYEYVLNEVLCGLEGISARPMFGGYGFYQEGFFFALIADGSLYFKVDKSNLKDYEERGSQPFVYESKKGKIKMSYYELPADILEDQEEIIAWVEKSVNIARKVKKK